MFLDSTWSSKIHWNEVCSMGLEIDCETSPLDRCPLAVIWEVGIQPVLISNGFKFTFIVPVASPFKPLTKLKPNMVVLDVESIQGR